MDEHIEIRRTRRFLLWLYAALSLAIALAGHFSYASYQSSLRAGIGAQLKAVAGLKATEISSWREEQIGDAAALAGNPIFANLVNRGLTSDTASAQALEVWLASARSAEGYNQIVLFDVDGVARFSVPPFEESIAPALSTQVAAALRTGEFTFTDFYRDDSPGHIHLATVAPIRSDVATSGPIGVLVLLTDPGEFIYPYIQQWPGDEKSAETLLVRREGNDALFLNDLLYRQDAALSLRVPLTRTDVPAVQAALGNEVVMDGTDYRGEPVVAATKLVAGSPWGVVARVDAAEVYAPLSTRLWATIVLVAATLGVGLLGIMLILRVQAVRLYREQVKGEAERSWLAAAIDDSLNEVYAFDGETLHFTYVNRGALKNIGYTMDELTHLTPVDIKPEYTDESFRSAVEPVLSGDLDMLLFETVHQRKDGTEYPVVVHLQITTRGGQRLFLAMINDITERRATEAELADHREHLELLVAQRTGQLQEANEELAATNEELAAANEDLFSANDEVAAVNEELAATNEELSATNEELSATNEELESSNEEMQTLYEEAAEASTELERLNSELALAGDAKSDFLASMSHELRTPLNSVIGFSDIMRQGMAGELNEEQQRQMEMINSSGKHLLSLINDVLDLTKVEAGRMEPEPEAFDLCEAVRETLDAVRPQADECGLALVADGIDAPCEIVSDARMVKQILLNLLSNAIKFTEAGTVSVAVVESDSSAEIAVADTGPGIAPDDLQRIFEAFTQVRVREHRPDGTGLGLAVSSKLTALLGGELSVVSARGEGSTFTLTLPKACGPAAAS